MYEILARKRPLTLRMIEGQHETFAIPAESLLKRSSRRGDEAAQTQQTSLTPNPAVGRPSVADGPNLNPHHNSAIPNHGQPGAMAKSPAIKPALTADQGDGSTNGTATPRRISRNFLLRGSIGLTLIARPETIALQMQYGANYEIRNIAHASRHP